MEISSTRLLCMLREHANIVLHVLRSGRHMSTAKQPNYGNVQLSVGPSVGLSVRYLVLKEYLGTIVSSLKTSLVPARPLDRHAACAPCSAMQSRPNDARLQLASNS